MQATGGLSACPSLKAAPQGGFAHPTARSEDLSRRKRALPHAGWDPQVLTAPRFCPLQSFAPHPQPSPAPAWAPRPTGTGVRVS